MYQGSPEGVTAFGRMWRQSGSETRVWDLIIVGILAAFCYKLSDKIFPLAEGRDVGTYYLYWRDFFSASPEYPMVMLFRTPVTPFFYGINFDLFGTQGVSLAVGGCYILTSLLLFYVTSQYSRCLGYLAVAMLFADLRFFERYNAIGSETMQTVLLVAWSCAAFISMTKGGVVSGLFLGGVTSLLVLNRPANQLLLIGCLLPLIGYWKVFSDKEKKGERRQYLYTAVTAFILAATVWISYATMNLVRYDQFCVAKLGGVHVPFYRLFLQQRLVVPENGPKSRELAEIVRTNIITDETFKKYGIDEKTFFEFATGRMFDHLIRVLMHIRGWDGDFNLLRDVAWETVRAHPKEAWLGWVDAIIGMYWLPEDTRPFNLSCYGAGFLKYNEEVNRRHRLYQSQGLQVPGEGDLICATGWWLAAIPQDANRSVQGDTDPRPWRYTSRKQIPEQWLKWVKWSCYLSPSWIYLGIGVMGVLLAAGSNALDPRIPLIVCVGMSVLIAQWFGVLLREFRYPFNPLLIELCCYGIFSSVCFFGKRLRLRGSF